MAKLKKLLGEIFEDTPKVDKHQVIEGVSKYGDVFEYFAIKCNLFYPCLFH